MYEINIRASYVDVYNKRLLTGDRYLDQILGDQTICSSSNFQKLLYYCFAITCLKTTKNDEQKKKRNRNGIRRRPDLIHTEQKAHLSYSHSTILTSHYLRTKHQHSTINTNNQSIWTCHCLDHYHYYLHYVSTK